MLRAISLVAPLLAGALLFLPGAPASAADQSQVTISDSGVSVERVTLFGDRHVVPGDSGSSTLVIFNERSTDVTVEASIVDVEERFTDDGDRFADDLLLTVDGKRMTARQFAAQPPALADELVIPAGASKSIVLGYEFPIEATSGRSGGGARPSISFDVGVLAVDSTPAVSGIGSPSSVAPPVIGTLPVTGAEPWWAAILVAALLLGMGWWLVLWRRRRRRDEEDVPVASAAA